VLMQTTHSDITVVVCRQYWDNENSRP